MTRHNRRVPFQEWGTVINSSLKVMRFGLALICAIAVFALPCSTEAFEKVPANPAFPHDAAPYRTYPIRAAFSPTGPRLTSVQRAWIRRILNSKSFARQRSNLRFVIISLRNIPIVVYVNTPAARDNGFFGGQVIGASCNTIFDPVVHGIFAGPICGPPLPTPTPF